MNRIANRKKLGIIGKGKLIQNFFRVLSRNHSHQSEGFSDGSSDDYFGGSFSSSSGGPAVDFAQEIGTILFYNPNYETTNDFTNSSGFKTIQQSLEIIQQNLERLAKEETFRQHGSLEWGVYGKAVRDNGKSWREGEWQEDSGEFARFVDQADVIIDTSAGFRQLLTTEGELRKTSLSELVDYLLLPPQQRNVMNPPHPDLKSDWDLYQQYISREQGKWGLSQQSFAQRWERTYALIQKVQAVRKNFADGNKEVGMRILSSLPFNAEIVLERGKMLSELLDEKKVTARPTYIMMANETSFAATLLGSSCPELQDYLLGWTNVDALRMPKVLNEQYSFVADEKRLRKLNLPVLCVHDGGLMVTVLHPENQFSQDGRDVLALLAEKVDLDAAAAFLQQRIGNFWSEHRSSEENDKIDVEYARSSLELIVNASRSRDRPISQYPLHETSVSDGRPLCNAYFQPNKKKEGLFLAGSHRFQNGRIIGEKVATTPINDRDLTIGITIVKEIAWALRDVLGADVHIPLRKTTDRRKTVHKDILSDYCLVATGKVLQGYAYDSHAKSWQKQPLPGAEMGDGKSEDKTRRNYTAYTALAGFALEGIPYVAAGHRYGIDIINLQRQQLCSISPAFQTKRRQRTAFRHLGLVSSLNNADEKALIAAHSDVGVLYIPLNRFEGQDHLQIDARALADYQLEDLLAADGPVRMAVHGREIYVAQGQKVCQYEALDDVTRGMPFPIRDTHLSTSGFITALSAADGIVFAGTNRGEIYLIEEGTDKKKLSSSLFFQHDPDAKAIILRMQSSQTSPDAVFYITAGGSGSVVYRVDPDRAARVVAGSKIGLPIYDFKIEKDFIVTLGAGGLVIHDRNINLDFTMPFGKERKEHLGDRCFYVFGGNET